MRDMIRRMDDDTQISPVQMTMATYGGLVALMKANLRHGLPLSLLLEEIRLCAAVSFEDHSDQAAEILLNLAAELESNSSSFASES